MRNAIEWNHLKVSEHSLRALYDLYCWRELARAQSFKKQAWRLYSDRFILFIEDCASVFSGLTIKNVCF